MFTISIDGPQCTSKAICNLRCFQKMFTGLGHTKARKRKDVIIDSQRLRRNVIIRPLKILRNQE